MNHHHPDDELLSAALDGETAPDTVAHVGGCDACLARLDALDGARRSVATDPGPTPAAVADRALAAAGAAWAGEQAAVTAPEPAATSPVASPVPTPGPATGATGGGARGDRKVVPLHRRSDRRTVPAWALGAVAALVAVLLAVPIVLDDDPDPAEQTASAPTGDAAGEASSLDAGVVEGGDLGSLSDPTTLRDQLLKAVPGAPARTAPAAAPTEGAAETQAAPAAEAPSTTTGFAARNAGGAEAAGTACRAEVRSEFGARLGALLYAAGLRWQGTDAVVLAYRLADPSAPGPDHLALVMARDDCRLLASQGF